MTKIVLIGAGSLQFGTGMLGDIFQSVTLKNCEIVLNDINLSAAQITKDKADAYIEANSLGQTVSVEADLNRALVGADYVVISIEVGDRFKLWDLDWKLPQQYGLRQVYGENGGPGGLFHSLRIIPPILKICDAIMEAAPDAVVFNYSNPMSRIVTTVKRAHPDLKFIGMCHEIASLERHLPKILKQPRENIRYRAGGLNHFSVMTDCQYADTGKDAYEDVVNASSNYFSDLPGYSEILNAARSTGKTVETEGWMDIDVSHISESRSWSDRWLFKYILDTFGTLPITYDSHFGEYIPWAFDRVDHRGIVDFYTYYIDKLGKGAAEIEPVLKERVVPIIDGIILDSGYEEAAVNILNDGYIADLPNWLAVEVPAIVDRSGVKGIKVEVPEGIRGLLCNQIAVHNLTAEAVLQQSRELVLQALLVDPVVSESKHIESLVDHMLTEQSPWLDYLK